MPAPEYVGWQNLAAQDKLDTRRSQMLQAQLIAKVGAVVGGSTKIEEIAPWLAPQKKRQKLTQAERDKKTSRSALASRLRGINAV